MFIYLIDIDKKIPNHLLGVDESKFLPVRKDKVVFKRHDNSERVEGYVVKRIFDYEFETIEVHYKVKGGGAKKEVMLTTLKQKCKVGDIVGTKSLKNLLVTDIRHEVIVADDEKYFLAPWEITEWKNGETL